MFAFALHEPDRTISRAVVGEPEEDDVDLFEGDNVTYETLCTIRNLHQDLINDGATLDPTIWEREFEEEDILMTYTAEEPNEQNLDEPGISETGTIEVEVNKPRGSNPGGWDLQQWAPENQHIWQCGTFQDLPTGCEGDGPEYDCTETGEDEETYQIEQSDSVTGVYSGHPVDYEITYTSYSFNDEPKWGPVNKELFGHIPNVNGDHESGYHAYGSSFQGRNSPSVSFNQYEIEDVGNTFEAIRQSVDVVNADGVEGRENALIAYRESEGVKGSTEGFLDSSLHASMGEYSSGTEYGAVFDENDLDVDCGSYRCIASVEVDTLSSGWSNIGESYDIDIDAFSVADSAGACEMYKELTGVSDDVLDCNPGPNYDVCGAYEWDQRVVKQGPEVDTAVEDHLAHYEACMDTRTQEGHCVLGVDEDGTELVEEGTVANIAPIHHDTEHHEDDYQAGGNSPDWSVCLDMDDSTVAGEWYNLDDPQINDYLREGDSRVVFDSSENSNVGELVNEPEWIERNQDDYEIEFDNGNDERAELRGDEITELDPAEDSFTIAAYVDWQEGERGTIMMRGDLCEAYKSSQESEQLIRTAKVPKKRQTAFGNL